jgi:hypothetical protein
MVSRDADRFAAETRLMNDRDASAAGLYALVPARSASDEALVRFAAAVWPGEPKAATGFMASWWRFAAPECAVAAIHQPTQAIVGLCGGRPSRWVIDGHIHPAISICDWYVDPGHEGKLLGRRLLRHFETPDRFLHAISISDAACTYVARMGWAGPYPSALLAAPLPRVNRLWHRLTWRPTRLEFAEYTVASGQALGALGAELDHLAAARAERATAAGMLRDAQDWAWRLSIYPDRQYRLCVAHRAGAPVGYVAIRRMTPGASRRLGQIPGALVTDLLAVDDDPDVLEALGRHVIALAADMRVGVALLLTTSAAAHPALARAGFLTPRSPVLGRLLRRRAPVFMWSRRGPGKTVTHDRITMTFADSTLDLDL